MEGLQFVRLAAEFKREKCVLLDFKKKTVDCSGSENEETIKYCETNTLCGCSSVFEDEH